MKKYFVIYEYEAHDEKTGIPYITTGRTTINADSYESAFDHFFLLRKDIKILSVIKIEDETRGALGFLPEADDPDPEPFF